MAYNLLPLQEVYGDRIAEVRTTEDHSERQALWQFEPAGTTPQGDLVYMLCTERLLGCLQFRPDPYPQRYTKRDGTGRKRRIIKDSKRHGTGLELLGGASLLEGSPFLSEDYQTEEA